MARRAHKYVFLFLEFIVDLVKVLWISLVEFIKLFLPVVTKKDVSKDIVLITGGGSGIGRLMALRFAKLGARVVLWDINKKANDVVAKEIKDKGQTAYSYQCDCSKREEVFQVAKQVKEEVGDVSILVNNAGIISGKKFFRNSDEMIDLTFKVNTVAHFWTIKAFVPSMIAKNRGHIITIASSAGIFGVSGLMDYCGSKFGAVGIHESLANELHAGHLDGIHTTLVCPYFINTGMFDGVKTRIPFLLPILEPDYAVNKIMTAFHSNQYMLLMPRILYVFLICQSLLPKRAMMVAGDFFGVSHTMDTFKGRQKQD